LEGRREEEERGRKVLWNASRGGEEVRTGSYRVREKVREALFQEDLE